MVTEKGQLEKGIWFLKGQYGTQVIKIQNNNLLNKTTRVYANIQVIFVKSM